LFLGFLAGVDFFWTMKNILPETLFLSGTLLFVFYIVDSYFYHKRDEILPPSMDPTPDSKIQIVGKRNFILFAAIIGLVLMSGLWESNVSLTLLGSKVKLQNLVRDLSLIVVLFISLSITPSDARNGNEFTWGPIVEVAKLFAGIFITIIPVIAILRAGSEGAFAFVLHTVTDQNGNPINVMYFWVTGLLSSFLDNAPTYLVFFNAAGGDPAALMTKWASTLAAISAGAVMMGANSYIGNAPSLMVKAIAEERGIKMPSFFGYIAWSGAVLIPLFVLMSLLFFR
jgi:Na+/H+ antiporter NhaD/arsenite permease-like protein